MYKTTLFVEGMMCEHCEAHANDAVKKCGEKIKKVTSSHKDKEVVILSKAVVDVEKIKEAIGECGYTVTSFMVQKVEKKSIFSRK